MTCPCEFPERPPMECIWEVFRIIRSGDVIGERNNLMRHVACITGGLANALAASTVKPIFGNADASLTINDVCDKLEAHLNANMGADGHIAAVESVTLDPVVVNLLIQLLQMALHWLFD